MAPRNLAAILDGLIQTPPGESLSLRSTRYIAEDAVTALATVARLSSAARDDARLNLDGGIIDGLPLSYEKAYGGVGSGYEGYERVFQAIHTLLPLIDELTKLGEYESAGTWYWFALALTQLPSWQTCHEFLLGSVFDAITENRSLTEAEQSHPAFLLLCPVAIAFHSRGDMDLFRQRYEEYRERYRQSYNASFRKFLAAFRAASSDNSGQFSRELQEWAIAPDQFFAMQDELVAFCCRKQVIEFVGQFMFAHIFDTAQLGEPRADSVVGLLLSLKEEFDQTFTDILHDVLGDKRWGFLPTASPEAQAGWWQLYDVAKLVGSLAEEGVTNELIRERIIAVSTALQYVHSGFMVSLQDTSPEPLQVVYRLLTAADPDVLEALLLEYANAFDDDFLLAFHTEQAATTAMVETGATLGDPVPGDVGRFRRLGEIILDIVLPSQTQGGALDRQRLRVACVIEALLHAALADWSLYRRSGIISACIPHLNDEVRDGLRQRLRHAQDLEQQATFSALEICEQVIARRVSGQTDQDLIDSMTLSMAIQEVSDEYSFLGPADGARRLQQLWLIGSIRHADGERHYAEERQVAQLAQEAALASTPLPPTVWEQYLNRLKEAGVQDEGDTLTGFIAEQAMGSATDPEAYYFRSYLYATRAVLALAHGEDPTESIGHSLGYAARSGVYPLVALFFPCWLVAAHYATGHNFNPDGLISIVWEHIHLTRSRFAVLLLRRFLPAFVPLRWLSGYRIDQDRSQFDRLLGELEEVEQDCGDLMQNWSLRAWASLWLRHNP